MPFHRLVTPTYFGGLPGTHDEINNATSGTPAPASAQQVGGTWNGTYFEVPGESATAANVNRSNRALAENTDFLDDIVQTSRPIPAFEGFTAGGGGDTQIQLTGDAFVGRSGVAVTQEVRDGLIQVVDALTLQPITQTTGVPIFVNDIRDSTDTGNVIGTEATGYHTQPIAVFSSTIPAATSYRLLYLGRGSVAGESDPADATGDMGYVSQLLIEASKQQAASGVPFTKEQSSWADTTKLSSILTQNAIDEIVTALADATANSGAQKIGAEGYVGTSLTLAAGTVESQLRASVDGLAGLAANNIFTGSETFQSGCSFQAAVEFQTSIDIIGADPFPINVDVNLEMNMPNNGVFNIDFGSTGGTFSLRDGTDPLFQVAMGLNSVQVRWGEADSGTSDPYDDGANELRGFNATTSGEAPRALELGPGLSNAQMGAPLILNAGGPSAGRGAGFNYGVLHMMFGGIAANLDNLRRTIIPTQIHRIDDGVGPIVLASAAGASEWEARDVPVSTAVLLEAYVVAVADDGSSTAAEDAFGAFVRRARGHRTAAGTRAVNTSSANQKVFDDYDFDESGGALVVDIIANTTGFHIQVTAPSGVSPEDALWWGYLIITPLAWSNNPDVVNP